MYFNKRFAVIFAAALYGKTPDEIREKLDSGLMSLQDLRQSAHLYAALNQQIEGLEQIYPGRKSKLREKKHASINQDNFELLLQLKQQSMAKQQQQEQQQQEQQQGTQQNDQQDQDNQIQDPTKIIIKGKINNE